MLSRGVQVKEYGENAMKDTNGKLQLMLVPKVLAVFIAQGKIS
ncbi:hypothetical protein BTJ44_00616 [Bacillus mycoides]|nr:hypothetical protein BTJ44_00616 [Bacillus mycoides]